MSIVIESGKIVSGPQTHRYYEGKIVTCQNYACGCVFQIDATTALRIKKGQMTDYTRYIAHAQCPECGKFDASYG